MGFVKDSGNENPCHDSPLFFETLPFFPSPCKHGTHGGAALVRYREPA
jgi:acyl dehydratase